ncbi:hypothetical protein GC170_18745 [bacterium]|nr:hypothetical protein [bacterium]
MNATPGSTDVVRIHLPEWRDSLAVNQEIRRALRSGRTDFLLTGARGDRLLLNGLDGPYIGRIRIDGDVGTELARDLDAEGLFVLVNGSAGSGAGMSMKSGTLLITGSCGALLGTGMRGGAIWALGTVGSRAGHRSIGGVIRTAHDFGPMARDRSIAGRIEPIRPDDQEARETIAVRSAMASFGEPG